MMEENRTDTNVTEVKCEELSGKIINIHLYFLLTVTTLSAILTVTIFLFTVIRANEAVERRRNPPSNPPSSPPSSPSSSSPPSPTGRRPSPSSSENEQDELSITNKYYKIPKHYSKEKIIMNINAINEKRLSSSSVTAQQNEDVEALSKRVFARSKSDYVKKLALRNTMRSGADARKSSEQDMRRRNSTLGGFEG